MTVPFQRASLNGEPADADAWRALASTNYGHFTAMQVRDGTVAGLDLHLQRLQEATRQLFGTALDVERLRAWLRAIVDGAPAALSLRISVFSQAMNRDRPGDAMATDVLIAAGPAREVPRQPIRVGSVVYQRDAPRIKHLGTFGLFQQKRLAQLRGLDDALFVGNDGSVSEGSIWNIGFFDDDGVVWPDAPMLRGIAMQLLQRGLEARGIASTMRCIGIDEIARFRGAFFTNSSCVALPIRHIDDIDFAVAEERLAMLQACYAWNEPQPI